MITRYTLLMLSLAMSAVVNADKWVSPQEKGAISSDGLIVIKVVLGESLGDTYGFSGSDTGKYATAKYLRWNGTDGFNQYQETQLLNPIAPVEVLIHDDGTLVTLDNWHNAGYGNVVVIYKPDGNLLKSFKLLDLYPEKAIADKIERTASSIWWRCDSSNPIIHQHSLRISLTVIDSLGGTFVFDLKTGEYTYNDSNKRCESEI